jgi:hypothetical protein
MRIGLNRAVFAAVLLAASVAPAALPAAHAAVDADAAACEPFAGPSAAVQGTGTWTPPVTTTSTNHVMTMSLTAHCDQGTGDEVGTYTFDVAGTSLENCAGGTGNAAVHVTTPHDGDGDGAITFTKGAVHYFTVHSSGTLVTSNGEGHTFWLWLDVIPNLGLDGCSYSTASIFGHAAVTDAPPFENGSVGGCSFDADSQATVTQPDTFVGVLGVDVTILKNGLPDSPSSVECSLLVNGNGVDHLGPIAGPHAVGAKPTSFVAHDGDVTTLCTTIHWSDNSSDTTCGDSDNFRIPPQQVTDLLDTVFVTIDGVLVTIDDLLNPVFDAANNFEKANIDPVVCPILAALAGTYGQIVIDAQGDVYFVPNPDPLGLGTVKIWDCPPYDA